MTDPTISRVLMIAPTPFFGDRGCHVRILEEVRALAALGIETTVTTYPAGNDIAGVKIVRSTRLPGVAPRELGPSWSRPVLDTALFATSLRAAREVRPDVLHAHLHEGIMIGAAVRAALGVPLVADLQGSLTEELIDHQFVTRDSPLAGGVRRLEQWIVRRPDALVVSSTATATMLINQGVDPARVESLPDGVDLDAFRPLPPDETLRRQLGIGGKRIVVFLGVLTPYQGVDVLLEAVPEVVRQVPDAHFLIMGYPNEEAYRALARDRGLEGAVTFPGRIPYSDAARWLCLGAVAVSAKSSLTEANGKLLNYMACGLPVVATDTPVNRELLGESGIYFRVGDARTLATELVALLRDQPGREALGHLLRSRAAQHFAWPALAEGLLAIYRHAHDRRRFSS